jgi:hypothetical protein
MRASMEDMRLREEELARQEEEMIRRVMEESLASAPPSGYQGAGIGGGGGRTAEANHWEPVGDGTFTHSPPATDHKLPPIPSLPLNEPHRTSPSSQPPISHPSRTPSNDPTSFYSTEFKHHQSLIDKLKAWQAGELPPQIEWHELIPPSLLLVSDPTKPPSHSTQPSSTSSFDPSTRPPPATSDSGGFLSKKEIERQGLLWEIFRSEQEYVKNLEGGLNGYYVPLMKEGKALMGGEEKLKPFLDEVFHNMATIFPKRKSVFF